MPIVLGGDHSIALGTLGGLAAAAGGPGAVLWIDAHGDLNTPQTTPSGNVHGMPLAAALGHGGEALRERGVAAAGARAGAHDAHRRALARRRRARAAAASSTSPCTR